MDRRDFLTGAALGAVAVAMPAIVRAQAKPVRIGVIQPMSGGLAAYATEGQPVFEYMIRQVNEAGGIKSLGGAKIEAVLADDTSQPARTAAEARRLVTEGDVVMLTGSILSAQMLALTPVVDELKIPTLSIWAGGVKSPYMYSLGFPYDQGYAQSLASFIIAMKKDFGFKVDTAAMAYSNYEAGQQVNKFLKEKLAAAGIKVVGDVPLDTKAQDQTAAMVLIRSMKPDVVTGLVTPRDGILLHQARFNLAYNDSVFVGGTGGYSDSSLWKELGPDIGTKVLTRNLFGMTGFSAGAKLPSMQAIVKELEGANLKVPIGQAAIQAAQAVRVIQVVLEKAGATDPEALLKGLKAFEIPFGDPALYLARSKGLRFGEDRMLVDSSALMIQWTPEKAQEVVFPAEFAQVKPRPKS
ncbi:ABC transporter substrate-binding protein [Chelatococcus reniformis]|uniref:Branched-chain amino acid ABC transporter substrate-binding protein n=1 Tax=Chelatococcus reniformis TaxID=1494448 RepID=A0A916USP7_9HYPH|nr:ABC transporter substrate-binding protein [Chelatococcus reniformis]GGC83148.1 branched-chain amino acid ABC transporter substrate-binding protein [Chelatococcus reniformis]